MPIPQFCSECELYRASTRTEGVGTCQRWSEAVLAHDQPCSDWSEVVPSWNQLIPIGDQVKVHGQFFSVA
ncbi:MAG: hypothetical protein WBA57_21355 [Elainellaceae cyanobacterium]